MKTLNIFKSFLLGLLIISCSASDDGGDSGSGNGNEEVTSITLTTASSLAEQLKIKSPKRKD